MPPPSTLGCWQGKHAMDEGKACSHPSLSQGWPKRPCVFAYVSARVCLPARCACQCLILQDVERENHIGMENDLWLLQRGVERERGRQKIDFLWWRLLCKANHVSKQSLGALHI